MFIFFAYLYSHDTDEMIHMPECSNQRVCKEEIYEEEKEIPSKPVKSKSVKEALMSIFSPSKKNKSNVEEKSKNTKRKSRSKSRLTESREMLMKRKLNSEEGSVL